MDINLISTEDEFNAVLKNNNGCIILFLNG